MRFLADIIRKLSLATRLLVCLWLLFVLLVAFGIHGSSTGFIAPWWSPGTNYQGYLFGIPGILNWGDPYWGNHFMLGERLMPSPGSTGNQIATNAKDTSSDVAQLIALQPVSENATIRRAEITTSNARGEKITIAKPPNLLSGDVLVAIVVSSFAYGGLPSPPGWTVIRDIKSREAIVSLDSYYRIVDGGEPPSWTWQLGSPNGNPNARGTAAIIAYRGVSLGAPIGPTNAGCCTAGSSTSVASLTTLTPNNLVVEIFAEGQSDSTYNPPADLTGVINVTLGFSAEATERIEELFMAKSRGIRGDEFVTSTPYALSQLSHQPRFPVVNTNIGSGQNMLVWWFEFPVFHPATLARPATWGYFFLGAQRGLAWFWWFQVFACFTALYLLFVIILKGHKELAAFGAFWFCGSAYIVCWSFWPARITFYIALACVCAYHLLASNRRFVQVVCAVLLGLSLAGFLMALYPPWQIALGYLFLFLFAALFIRDKLYLSFRSISIHRFVCISGAVLLAAALITSFLVSCLPDLKIMSGSVYPGQRFSKGGDYSFLMLFKGMYNMLTIYEDTPPGFLVNQSEAASFYHLFPAVIVGIFLSRRLISKLGVLGWFLVGYLVVILYFMFIGLPEFVARATLLSHVPSKRIDLGVGLASIALCIYVLALNSDEIRPSRERWYRIMPLVASVIITGFFLLHGVITVKESDKFPPIQIVLLASVLAGLASFSLLSGRRGIFCGVMGTVVLATSALFNPLSTNLSHIYDSELAHQVVMLDRNAADRPVWLCYGNVQTGILINALGGRTLTGQHWPPQLSLWRRFDPDGQYINTYNNLAHIIFVYDGEKRPVTFSNPNRGEGVLVHISPNDPILREMGARYVLAFDDYQQALAPANLNLIYRSATGRFSIFEIPR